MTGPRASRGKGWHENTGDTQYPRTAPSTQCRPRFADDLLKTKSRVTLTEEEDSRRSRAAETANLSSKAKTKLVTFGSKAIYQAFMFNGNEVDRVELYKYLRFEFHTIKNLAQGVLQRDSAEQLLQRKRCIP